MQIVDRNELWDYDIGNERDALPDVIYYQQKGYYPDSLYYKTFLWTSEGDYHESTGTTLEASIALMSSYLV